MSVGVLGTHCDQRLSTVQCCFTSAETVRLVRSGSPGRPHRLSHCSWVLKVMMVIAFIHRYSPPSSRLAGCRLVECCFTSTEAVGLLGTGAQDKPSRIPHSSRALKMMKCWLMSSDVSWHIRDKLWPVPKHGSINLYVHGNQKAR